MREHWQFTQESLANTLGISKQLILRNEQAVYTQPSPTLLEFFSGNDPLVMNQLTQDYLEFQKAVRKNNFGKLVEPPPSPLVHFPPDTNKDKKISVLQLTDHDYAELITKVIELPETADYSPVGKVDPDLVVFHPFKHWRLVSDLNLNQVSKMFCIQHSLLYKLENQTHLVESLPQQLIDALLVSGYSQQTIDNEVRWFAMYKDYLNSLVNVS